MTPTQTIRFRRHVWRAALVALLAAAAPAAAQDAQSNTTLPQTIPGLGNFSIAPRDRLSPAPLPNPTPTPTPAPSIATPAARTPIVPPHLTIEPLPAPTPRAAAPPRRPTPASNPAPIRPMPTTTPAAMPAPVATPAAIATPAGVPSQPVAAAPAPAPAAATVTPPARPSKIWIFVLLAMLLLPGAVVAAWFYRRSLPAQGFAPTVVDDDDDDDWVAPAEVAPMPAVVPPSPAVAVPRRTPGSTARAQIEVAFRPRRAGTNLTSAAVDYELVVRNAGSAPAHDVRLSVDLITAGNAHDAELKALFENGVTRPIVAPFDLAPGEDKGVKAVAMLPKEAINVVSVKGRPMFVPMVAVNVLYGWNGGSGQTATSHVIGIARAEGERMRPFWLDQTQRMHDSVSERAHAVAVRR